MLTILSQFRRHVLYKQHHRANAVQMQVKEEIMLKLQNTLYAQEYGTEFEKLPIVTYEDISKYIERMLSGENNILSNEKITLFAKSSGTTNAKSKYLPTPRSYLKSNHYRGGKDMAALYIASSHSTRFLAGKTLGISGSLSLSPGHPDILCGDVSALLVRELPWWAISRRAFDLSIALLPSWEEKMLHIVSRAKEYDIRVIAGTPTWVSILLKNITLKEKVQYIEEVWPKLEVFFHGAVSFLPYKPMFEKLSKKLKYFEVYNASEGCIAVQNNLKKPGELLLLINHSIFYEFIPVKNFGSKNQKIYKLHEVEIGEVYVLVISTTSGLYRYVIGDTIRFTSINPYCITITGRTKHFINAFGEEIVVENANVAILEACKKTSAVVAHYTAGPVYMDEGKAGAHEWYIEYTTLPNNQEEFNKTLDKTLRAINSDYDAKRTGDKVMKSPIINVTPEGTFYEFMKIRGKLGGQHKVPPLSNNRECLEEIKKIIQK